MADFASLQVALDLQTASFEKGVNQANKSMKKMENRAKETQQQFSKLGSGMATALKGAIALAGVSFSSQFVKDIITTNSELAKMARQTGFGVEAYQELQYASERAGVASTQFNSNMTAFVKRVGEARNGVGPLVTGLKKLDQSLLEALQGAESQEKALEILADGMQQSSSATERAAIANAAFGRSGIAMVNVLSDGSAGLHDMAKQARQLGLVIDQELIAAAEDYDDMMLDIQKRTKATFGKAILTGIQATMDNVGKIMWSLFAGVDKGWESMRVGAKIAWVAIEAQFKLGVAAALVPVKKLGELGGEWNPFSGMTDNITSMEDVAKEAGIEIELLRKGLADYKTGVDGIVIAHFSEVDAMQLVIKEQKRLKRERQALINQGGIIPPELPGATAEASEAMSEYERQLKRASEAMESTRVAALNMEQDIGLVNEKMEILKNLLEAGDISESVFDKMAKGLTKVEKSIDEVDEKTVSMFESIKDFAVDGVGTMVDEFYKADQQWGEFAKNFLVEMSKMIVKQQIFNALSKTSWFGGTPTTGETSAYSVPGGIGGELAAYGEEMSTMQLRSIFGGSRSQSGETVVNVNNYSTATATVKETTTADGGKTIDVLIKEQVNAALKAGGLDRQMNSNYGLARVGM